MANKMITEPIRYTEAMVASWDKADQPIIARSAARFITFLAVETLALIAVAYHSIALSSKAACLGSKAVLCSIPLAKAQVLGQQIAHGLSWQKLQAEHLTPGIEAVYEGIGRSLTVLVQPSSKLPNIRKALLPQLDLSPSLLSRAYSFVKQPKVLAALAVGVTLASWWYFSQSSPFEKDITLGTTYVNGDNKLRDTISKLINQNHHKYTERWGLHHEIEDKSLLQGQCTVNGKAVDCEPYWNKVAVLNRWLNDGTKPSNGKEAWYIMVDDDMAVTNMKIDPSKAIDALRDTDSSIIIAQDVMPWRGNPVTSVNTGLMIVRKDDQSRSFFRDLWEQRNRPTYKGDDCPTLGVCKQQKTLHEQEGFSNLLIRESSLLNRIVASVPPRETSMLSRRSHIALNTFQREGCYVREQEGWSGRTEYRDAPSGHWKPGDWMGQTAGVPLWGWWCGDYDSARFWESKIPPGPIRLDRINQMLRQVVD